MVMLLVAALLRSIGETIPVIVAEICVQRVQIETHSHGGAHELRDHLSKPRWEGSWNRNGWEQVPALSSLCVIVLSIQPLGSTALQTTQGISHVMQSVSKFAIFTLKHCVEGRVGGVGRRGYRWLGGVRISPPRCAQCAHLSAVALERAERGDACGFHGGCACALGPALDRKRWSVTSKSLCLFVRYRRTRIRIGRVKEVKHEYLKANVVMVTFALI